MGVKKIVTRQMLEENYLGKNVSMREACEALDICPTTLIKALREHGIAPKPRSWNHRRKNRFPLLQDVEWLQLQMETKSLKTIAIELGTSQGNVSDHAKRHGIRSRYASRNEAVTAGMKKRFPDGRFGVLATNWKGGKRRGGAGMAYVYIHKPKHPHATSDGYVMEHRLVMEAKLGRLLQPEEVVHHKNGLKDDNRPDNLEVMTRAEHVTEHFDAVSMVHELEQENQRLRERLGELVGEA